MAAATATARALPALVEGMDVDEAIRRMEGIKCGMKNTSCPDQLAQALRQTKTHKEWAYCCFVAVRPNFIPPAAWDVSEQCP